jgi:hypothetical protein
MRPSVWKVFGPSLKSAVRCGNKVAGVGEREAGIGDIALVCNA